MKTARTAAAQSLDSHTFRGAILELRRYLNLKPLTRANRNADEKTLAKMAETFAQFGAVVDYYGHPARRLAMVDTCALSFSSRTEFYAAMKRHGLFPMSCGASLFTVRIEDFTR